MSSIDKERKNKLLESILSCKIIYAVVLLSIFYTSNKEEFQVLFDNLDVASTVKIALPILLLCVIFGPCIYFSYERGVVSKPQAFDIIECLAFISCGTVIVYLSGGVLSYEKFSFIFIVIIYTIQFGKFFGNKVSSFITLILLLSDVLTKINTDVVALFQRDVLLCVTFFILVWILDMYISTEASYVEHLLKMANYDGLTNIFNRRYFQSKLKDMTEETNRKKSNLSLIIMDIDHFKNFNDTNGHVEGDALLKRIAKVFTKNVRSNDIVARYGGEEFVILLPNTSISDAYDIAERVRIAVESTTFKGGENQPNGRVSVSVGVSCYPSLIQDSDKLVSSADSALYEAKQTGRNQVKIYKEPNED